MIFSFGSSVSIRHDDVTITLAEQFSGDNNLSICKLINTLFFNNLQWKILCTLSRWFYCFCDSFEQYGLDLNSNFLNYYLYFILFCKSISLSRLKYPFKNDKSRVILF